MFGADEQPGALPRAALVELRAAGFEADCLVRDSCGDRLTLEIVLTPASAAVGLDVGDVVTIVSRGARLRASWPARVEGGGDFPLLAVRLTAAGSPLPENRCARIAIAFPVRYQVLPADPEILARRLRKRLEIRADMLASGSPAREPEELAMLALAKMMARLDARFDGVLERGQRDRSPRRAARSVRENSHDVVVFSIARMMMARLDRKFDRLLAAVRDPSGAALSAREPKGDEGQAGASSAELCVLHALNRLLERLSEKFELVVAALEGEGGPLSLDHAWGLGVSEEGILIGVARPLELDAILDLDLQLPSFPPVPLLTFGRVVEVTEQSQDLAERRFRALVDFVSLPDADRDLLVRLIFRKQRELLRARHSRVASD